MRTTIQDQLAEALNEIDRPGSFCTTGSTPAVLPGLEVEGMGPVGLPLTVKQARELKKLCDQAPYGNGEQTLVDTKVRRVWRMTPDRFSLNNPDWDQFVHKAVARVQEELGLESQTLESHLYDLLLYESGSFFLPHRDGEKLDRMVATLVFVLPSSYEGGELVVRHEGQEQTIDFTADPAAAFHVRFAAFYADCEHEVRPLTKGYRLCLVYNLTLARPQGKAKTQTSLDAPKTAKHVQAIAAILREWSKEDSPRKLAVILDHQYTRAGLAWNALKGLDRARANILADAAHQANCRAYLALLTLWESGSAGDPDYGYRRRDWYRSAPHPVDDKAGRYTMDELFDNSLTAEPVGDRDGGPPPLKELTVGEDELLDPDAIRDVKPEEDYQGYTGNEGMTLERWYRRAAILVWPERRQFEILCDRDGPTLCPC